EARRLAVIQKYLRDHEDPAAAMMAPGSYFAGFVFEKSGRPDEALRYYDEALQFAKFPSLVEPVKRLSAISSYTTPRLRKLVEGASGAEEPASAKTASDTADDVVDGGAGDGETGEGDAEAENAPSAAKARPAELLVVISYGRVPAKVAHRVP